MRRTWEWLGLNLGKHAGVVACIGLAITIVLGVGLSSVHLSTGDSDYLNANDPLAIGNQEYTSLFGGDPIAVLFTMKPGTNVDDLLTPTNQVEMGSVDEELAKNPSIFNVVSPLTALEFASRVQGGQNLTAQMFVSAYQRDPSSALAGGPRGLCRRRGAPVGCHCAIAKGSVQPGVDPLRPSRTQWFASRGG